MRWPLAQSPPSIVGAALAALMALADPALVRGSEPAAPAPGAWVKVRTSAELAPRARRSVIAEDGESVTFEIDGKAVRMMRPSREAEGRLRLLDAAALVLDRGAKERPIVVPRNAIAGFEVRVRESRKTRGTLIGLLGGAALGALIGAATSGQDGLGIDAESMGAAAGAVIGAPTGALVGFLVAPGARWEPHRGGAPAR